MLPKNATNQNVNSLTPSFLVLTKTGGKKDERKKELRKNAWLSEKNSQESNKTEDRFVSLKSAVCCTVHWPFFHYSVFYRDFFPPLNTHTLQLTTLKLNLTSNRKTSILLKRFFFSKRNLVHSELLTGLQSTAKHLQCSEYMMAVIRVAWFFSLDLLGGGGHRNGIFIWEQRYLRAEREKRVFTKRIRKVSLHRK